MYKIIEWNINQATNRYNKNMIPSFVGEYINLLHPDIIVLTEFCFVKNVKEFFCEYFESHNYSYFPNEETENKKNGQNEVLIAWRNDLFEAETDIFHSEIVTYTNNKPNYVRVCLRDKIYNIKFYIVGLRITLADIKTRRIDIVEMNRRQQLEYVLQDIEKSTLKEENIPVIITGDFNCFRRGHNSDNWSLKAIRRMMRAKAFDCKVPKGSSIYQAKSFDVDYEFPEDLIMGKNVSIKVCKYDRRFTYLNPEIYLYGEDFSVYSTEQKKTIWSVQFGSGIPDHAVMVADVEFAGNIV